MIFIVKRTKWVNLVRHWLNLAQPELVVGKLFDLILIFISFHSTLQTNRLNGFELGQMKPEHAVVEGSLVSRDDSGLIYLVVLTLAKLLGFQSRGRKTKTGTL